MRFPNVNSAGLQITNCLLYLLRVVLTGKKTQIYFIELPEELKLKIETIKLTNLQNNQQQKNGLTN